MTRSRTKPDSRTMPAKRVKSKSKKTASRASSLRGGTTKHDRVLSLLRTRGGVTIAAIIRVTGWKPHSVRGFLAGVVKKKLRLTLASEKTSSGRVYRIVEAKPFVSSRKAAVAVEQSDA